MGEVGQGREDWEPQGGGRGKGEEGEMARESPYHSPVNGKDELIPGGSGDPPHLETHKCSVALRGTVWTRPINRVLMAAPLQDDNRRLNTFTSCDLNQPRPTLLKVVRFMEQRIWRRSSSLEGMEYGVQIKVKAPVDNKGGMNG